ncbi:MAG: hypothetical protein ACE5J3_08135 [Methanosarcinales archaeon]
MLYLVENLGAVIGESRNQDFMPSGRLPHFRFYAFLDKCQVSKRGTMQ